MLCGSREEGFRMVWVAACSSRTRKHSLCSNLWLRADSPLLLLAPETHTYSSTISQRWRERQSHNKLEGGGGRGNATTNWREGEGDAMPQQTGGRGRERQCHNKLEGGGGRGNATTSWRERWAYAYVTLAPNTHKGLPGLLCQV